MADTPPAATPPSSSAADEAKARREARKARILNKGNDRLAKLTKQARGDEAEMLYGGSSGAAGTATPPRKGDQLTGEAAPSSMAVNESDDPPEIDISRQGEMDQELQRSMQMFQQRQQAGQQQQQGQQLQDPFQQMMAAMMGGGGGGGGPGGQLPQGMPDLSQLFAAMQGEGGGAPGGGGGGGPGQPPVDPSNLFAPAAPRGKRLSDRLFSVVHTALFVIVGYIFFRSTFAAAPAGAGTSGSDPLAYANPELQASFMDASDRLERTDKIYKWASLAYYRPSVLDARYFNVDASWAGMGNDVPVLYLLLTLTLTLQVLRLTILRATPPPSSMLFTLASQLPFPTLQWALKLGARYVNILTTLLDDVALVVFGLGMAVITSVALSGGDPAMGVGSADVIRARSAVNVLGSDPAAIIGGGVD